MQGRKGVSAGKMKGRRLTKKVGHFVPDTGDSSGQEWMALRYSEGCASVQKWEGAEEREVQALIHLLRKWRGREGGMQW